MIILEETSLPKYTQIYQQLKDLMINTKQLPPGCKLPSSRQLSKTLSVSRNTVCSAYEQLYAEGYIERRQRQGYFVSEFNIEALVAKPTALEKMTPIPAVEKVNICCPYDFRPRRVDLNNFPFPLWNKLLSKAVNDYKHRFFAYGHPQGELTLRTKISQFLAWYRGISCLPEQIVLCDGTQQALTLIYQLLHENLNSVAIEDPGNYGARVVFRNCGLPVIPIPVEKDGVNVDHLRVSGAGAIYVTPSRQFPTGVVMSVNKRTQLLDWANRNDAIIIEDDFNCYFRFNSRSIPALLGMGNMDRVIYLGSFAQAVFPATRISYIVLPLPLLNKYISMFQHYDSPVATLLQKTMELFIDEGHFERHLRKMNQIYKKKHDILIKALQEKLGNYITINSSNAGLHVLITVNDTISEQELIDRAELVGVKIGSITKHFMHPSVSAKPTILLSFSWIDQKDILPAVELLKQAWIIKK